MAHYLSLQAHNDTITDFISYPVTGFLKRYSWASLDSDMSELLQDLVTCWLKGKKLVVMVEDKTFGSLVYPTPADLQQYCLPNTGGGYSAIRWHPEIVKRYSRVLRSISGTFGQTLSFGGIALQESAPSLSSVQLSDSGYTPQGYADALVAVIQSCVKPWWFFNYIPGDQTRILDVVNRTGTYAGGPDCWPTGTDNGSIQLRAKAYPLYPSVPHAFIHMSLPSYSQGTTDELFAYAVGTLKVKDVFWVPGALDKITATILANPNF